MNKSERYLAYWYGKYNRLYFDSQLPDAKIWWEPISGTYADCQLVDGIWRVRLNPSLSGWPQMMKLTLLHELVHIKLHPYQKHGKRFNDEMRRLAGRGAFDKLW